MDHNSLTTRLNAPVQHQPSLLLHACCAPCSTSVYEKLCSDFDLTVYWYNPNIFPAAEHNRRLFELEKLSKIFDFKLVVGNSSAKDYQKWLDFHFKKVSDLTIKELFLEPEGGLRCQLCYLFRMKKTAQFAKNKKFNYFTTTLTVSPHKNTPKILEIGNEISEMNNGQPKSIFLAKNFQENNGYKRSVELSKKLSLYRQNYCGCEYSLTTPAKLLPKDT